MKSRRVLTVLLSIAIMLTFMPTMAFAANPGTADEGHDFTILADKSNVEYTIEPTCTTPGIGVVTCTKSHGGVQCKATKNVNVPALGHDYSSDNEITVTAEEFAAQMVKEGAATEAEAKDWLNADGKQLCTGKVYPCKNCGMYFVRYHGRFSPATFSNFFDNNKSIEHVAPEGTKACAATFDCVVCGQKDVSNATYNAENSAAYHGFDADGNWTLNNNFKVKTPEYKVHTLGEEADGKAVYATVYECKDCGLEMRTHRVEGAAIENFEHKNTYTVTVDPTCTTQGFTATFCSDCGYQIKGEGKGALGHSWAEQTLYPADEYDGELVGNVCTRCGKVDYNTIKEVTLPIKHNVTATVVAPKSCTDCTWILVQCTNPICKAEEQAFFIQSKEDVEKIGSKYYATFDGEKVAVPFEDATGHTWGDKKELHAATCTEKAEEGRTCTVCGAINHNSVRETAPALGHAVEETVVAPTCGKAGYTYKICTRCSNYLSQDGKTVLGKDAEAFEAAKYAPTNPVVKLGTPCTYEWKVLEEATPFKLGTRAKVCTVCEHMEEATKESIAKKTIAAPKVKALKKKAKVTVKAVEGAVQYQILVNGKVSKTVKKAGTFTVKKYVKASKKGTKNTFKIRAINADGVKATSKAKSVKIKKK